jgi:phosphohistidine phosphatase
MGKLARDKKLVPDLIVSSTARRAKKTAEAVAEKSKYKGELRFDQELYLAGPAAIVGILRQIENPSADRVMVVGHNPGQEELIRALTGKEEVFPTAALAQIELPIDSWKDIDLDVGGKLVQLWRPKELDK